jgi:hypothetical protein
LLEDPQLGAVAVHLVAAGEVEAQTIGVCLGIGIDGLLALGARLQLRRQSHPGRRLRIVDMLGRDPLLRADQRVPGALPHAR